MELVIPPETKKFFLLQRSEPTNAIEYAEACRIDFEAMRPWLLKGDVLDIGCGLATTSTMIAKYCGGKLHLLDGTGMAERRINYGPTMEPYNDRSMTELMLSANGITNFEWHDIGATELPVVENVVSLISWGWHYPVSTYLEAVAKALPIGGRLILDLRPGKGGEVELDKYFEHIANYRGFGKCNKTVWKRRDC